MMGNGFAKIKKQARQMQMDMEKQMEAAKEERKNQRFEGISGNGLVALILDGDKTLKEIKIKPECVNKEDIEGLQDLIIAAHENALEKIPAEDSSFPFPV
jgi:DNA-binding YbaB/EbfC family protein